MGIGIMSFKEERKKAMKNYSQSSCEWCGEKFSVKRRWQKFCSSLCRFKDWDKNHPRTKAEVA